MSEIQKLMKDTIDKEIVPSPTCTKNQIKKETFVNYR